MDLRSALVTELDIIFTSAGTTRGEDRSMNVLSVPSLGANAQELTFRSCFGRSHCAFRLGEELFEDLFRAGRLKRRHVSWVTRTWPAVYRRGRHIGWVRTLHNQSISGLELAIVTRSWGLMGGIDGMRWEALG